MKEHKHFIDYLKRKKFHFNEIEFNNNMMYRAKIFNQYHRQYIEDCGKTADLFALEWEVKLYEEKLHMP